MAGVMSIYHEKFNNNYNPGNLRKQRSIQPAKKLSADTVDVIAFRSPEDFKSNNLFVNDSSLDEYVRTWVGKNGNDSFKLAHKNTIKILATSQWIY
jgi:hypothetical protein